jgi:UDP-glucuronate 4-epimerase
MQPGDVRATYADVRPLAADFGFSPATPFRTGCAAFVDWYQAYYGARTAPAAASV